MDRGAFQPPMCHLVRWSVPPSVAGVDLHAQGGTHHGETDGDDHQESGGKVVIHVVSW